MKESHFIRALCASFFSLISMPSHAALVDNGGGLIYDDVLDITWSQPDVPRTWDNANTWASGLTLGGVSDWRLPYISVAEGTGPFTGSPVDCNTETEAACQDNELGYMFYQNLSGTFGQSILTSGDPDLDLFPTLQPSIYWPGTDFDSVNAWGFHFFGGFQDFGFKGDGNGVYSWAVHSGDVGAVPVPAAVWLFGSALLGLGVVKRKKA